MFMIQLVFMNKHYINIIPWSHLKNINQYRNPIKTIGKSLKKQKIKIKKWGKIN
jgi:hypothetical protein